MITNRSRIFLENDKVAIMCAINTLYCISSRISRSLFHAKTLPPSFIQPLLFFALCCRGLLCCGFVAYVCSCAAPVEHTFRVFLFDNVTLIFAWITFGLGSLGNQKWFYHLCKCFPVLFLQLFQLVFAPRARFLV